jgi:hypothetical protein
MSAVFKQKKICENRLSGLVARTMNVVRTAATRSIMILGEYIMKYMSCKAEILTVHSELKVKKIFKKKSKFLKKIKIFKKNQNFQKKIKIFKKLKKLKFSKKFKKRKNFKKKIKKFF